MTESTIQNDILVAVTALPGALLFRQNSGVFFTKSGRPVRAAVPGAGDIMGAYNGRPVAIEVKTATGSLRRSQTAFRAAWERAGGLYIVARSVDDALAGLGAHQ